jgi:hypothetical protein
LQYTDSLGAADLTTVWVWFTSNFNMSSATNTCLAYYATATNQMFLLNDAGTLWSSASGGSPVTLSNSQCSINVGAMSVTAPGVNLIMGLPVTFSAAYAGAQSIYMYAEGSTAKSVWQVMGTWTVPAAVSGVSPISIAPASGSGFQQTFTLKYADPLGPADLATVWIWFAPNFNMSSAANSCLAYYATATNQLFLLNDAGTLWSSASGGSPVTLSNSQCSLNPGMMSVTAPGTNLVMTLPVTFTAAYAGTQGVYMYAAGSTAKSGWQAMGSWTVP